MSPGQRGMEAQYARRVNAAAALLATGRTVVEAAGVLARRFGVSERQSRRYAEQARDGGMQAVPPPKVVFTVKLPADVLRRVRQRARSRRQALSALVEQVLADFLSADPAGRRGGGSTRRDRLRLRPAGPAAPRRG